MWIYAVLSVVVPTRFTPSVCPLREDFRMRWTVLLLKYVLVKVLVLLGSADGQLEGFIMLSGSNGSRDEESGVSEPPHIEDKCRGYYDVMGQWDPPFVCRTGNYLYCCGTCGFRFCCAYKNSRLDQSTCKNYDTPVWLTGQTPYKKKDPRHDPTRDKTNMIVYVICGVVAIMALVGIFTKLGLEKAHRPHRESMSRAVASVMQGARQSQHEEAIGMHTQHYDTVQARAHNMQGGQISNMMQTRPYPALSQLSHVYEQQHPGKEVNKYASLKAVADKANGDLLNKQHRHLVELAAKGTLPLHPVRIEHVEPTASYVTEIPCLKQNGQKPKSSKPNVSHPAMTYSSNTIANPGMLRSWEATETVGRRKTYGTRKLCTVQQVNELHTARSHHYLPTQPYFVTNSKTEVTV
ncbi:protein shisa-9A [Misgurnus anguillicaudatus]|uniref:protein shisa-9A n=1 Tax=Misgurnus anguillicaudatus TaxID=75329 RepID=UPI002435A3AD|nr:protein shisa-9A [Misgurnus anguillicaudatus]